uniref:Uncharacterized protein n=1 Tax=Anguilla anguilla TaxID=7936 RepID=A0A0E9WZE1_ANGAN
MLKFFATHTLTQTKIITQIKKSFWLFWSFQQGGSLCILNMLPSLSSLTASVRTHLGII